MRTVRAFAERVVLSTDLADKLALPPPGLIDEDRGGGTDVRAPGRAPELAFTRRDREKMPRAHELGNDRKRAVCLHRFANHELQAIEVMAWALLAFPQAPAGFRAGLLATLADEQQHCALYTERLRALGVPFGSLPVNDYFWARVPDLETPLHYVAAMGLTFEAGNLDHSAAYRDAFRAVGDDETAKVVARVHEDEIGHVRFAVTWLQKLKRPGESDAEAWLGALRFPLAPHRAKGPVLLREPRVRAGLPDEIIDLVERAGPARTRA